MFTPDTQQTPTKPGAIETIKANDEQALRALYIRNYPGVEQYVLNNGGSVPEAKDIYQEAFIAAWRNISLGRFAARHEDALNSYLFQIARNKWTDVLRQRKSKIIRLSGPEVESAQALPAEEDQEELGYIEKVRNHFNLLGSPCRELLGQFYFERKKLRDIAAFFSWTEATAKNNKYRCLQKLRAAVMNDKQK